MARLDARSEAQTRRLLSSCDQVAITDTVIERARELASGTLRTLDAIHLATALRVAAQRFLTYDRRLAEAASAAGLRVLSPGAA